MKVTDNDFESFVRNMTEICIKSNRLPKDFVMDEKSLDILESIIDSERQRIEDKKQVMPIEQRITASLAYAFMRGYAEGKYHGWEGEDKK